MTMKKRIRTAGALTLAAITVLSAAGLSSVYGALGVDTEQKCSLTFTLDGTEFAELNEVEIPVDVYQIADITEEAQYTAHTGYEGLGLDQIEETEEEFRIGCMVTLRGERMYEFLDRLVTIAFPRVRDFRGVSARSFDGRGNYNIGLKEQIIFPEIEYDKIDKLRGMNISITTTAKTDEEAKALLAAFHFPFRN